MLTLPDLNYDLVVREVSSFILSYVSSLNVNGVVIGLSGGLDSSVTADLSVKALGSSRVLGLIMPDSDITPREDVDDALNLASILKIKHQVIDIKNIVEAYRRSVKLKGGKVAEGNLRARIRMSILYYYANSMRMLVAGTGDRSEVMIGYFTKYGDGGADILPIGCLYKTTVRRLASYLKLPESIVNKPSSPRLWRSHLAEEELGISYNEIDIILYGLYDLGLSSEELSRRSGIGIENIERIRRMKLLSEHKRKTPPIPQNIIDMYRRMDKS
jgi:NAD+ synthase